MKLTDFDYCGLIESFLNKEISADEFEDRFNDVYLKEPETIRDDVFEILDWLFAEIDMFTDLPVGPDENPDDYINEDQLRKSAAEKLQELRELEKAE